jgi:hypothetical protein
MQTQTLKAGDKAYYDSFNGMIRCKVLAITGTSGAPTTAQSVKLLITATSKLYREGEIIETNGLHSVPLKSFYYGPCGIGRIRFYLVEVTV